MSPYRGAKMRTTADFSSRMMSVEEIVEAFDRDCVPDASPPSL